MAQELDEDLKSVREPMGPQELGWGSGWHGDPCAPPRAPGHEGRRWTDAWTKGWHRGVEDKQTYLEVRAQKRRTES